jgi:hypothetical protein
VPYSRRQVALATAGAVLLVGGIYFVTSVPNGDGCAATGDLVVATEPRHALNAPSVGRISMSSTTILRMSERWILWDGEEPDTSTPDGYRTQYRAYDIISGRTRDVNGSDLAGDLIASRASYVGPIEVEDIATGRRVFEQEAPAPGAIRGFDGSWIILEGSDGLRSLDVRTGTETRVATPGSYAGLGEGRLLLHSHASDGTWSLELVDLATGRSSRIGTWPDATSEPIDPRIGFDGRFLTSSGETFGLLGPVHVVDADTRSEKWIGQSTNPALTQLGNGTVVYFERARGDEGWHATELATNRTRAFGVSKEEGRGAAAGGRAAYDEGQWEPPLSKIRLACLS